MTPEEQWLNQNTGYCARLFARITPAQCEMNKKEIVSCNGCGGLGMENKFKSGHNRCSVAGCEKQAWKAGMCYKHFHQQAELSQIEPKASQTESKVSQTTGIQNQEALDELADELEKTPPPPVELAGLPALLPVVADAKPGFFLDFSDKRTEFNILQKHGVTPDQVVQMLCLVAGGGYELRKVA